MTETRTGHRVPMRLRVDQAIEQLLCDRAALLGCTGSDRVARCELLAASYRREAHYWELLVEYTQMRVLWRAALGARSDARASARFWAEQAQRWRQLACSASLAVPRPTMAVPGRSTGRAA